MLESVATYCLERLVAPGELLSVRERHDQYFAALAERASAGLRVANACLT